MIVACFWMSEDVNVVAAGYVLMPLLCSEASLKRKAEEWLEWDESEDCRDVSRVTEDFFAVFCVAVRLHSVKRTPPTPEVVCFSMETPRQKGAVGNLRERALLPEFSASRILPQQRYVLHCLLTFSFAAQ